jgi:hypothetical protein
MIPIRKSSSSKINPFLFSCAMISTTVVAMHQSNRQVTIENISQLNIYIDQTNTLIQPKHKQTIKIDPQEETIDIELFLPGCRPPYMNLKIGKEVDQIIYNKCYKTSDSIPVINTITNVLILNRK